MNYFLIKIQASHTSPIMAKSQSAQSSPMKAARATRAMVSKGSSSMIPRVPSIPGIPGMSTMATSSSVDVPDGVRSQLQVIEIASLSLQALFALILYHYVTRLERIGCECAQDNTRLFIQYYSLALFAVVVIKMAILLTGSESTYLAFSAVMAPILLVSTVVYVIYVIKYINRLRREKCQCSATVSRTVIYVYAIIQAIGFAYVALVLLSLLIVLFMTWSSRVLRV